MATEPFHPHTCTQVLVGLESRIKHAAASRHVAGADPGFPVGGGADSLGGGPTYDFVKLSQKLHEIEKILGRRGGARRERPLGSATV